MEQSKILKKIKQKIIFPEQIDSEKKIMKKIEKIFENEVFHNYFKKEFLKKENKEIDPNSMKEVYPYKPQIRDLFRVYEFIKLNKRTTVLEIGSGWSTLFISLALDKLRQKYGSKIQNLRRTNPFYLFSLENEKKFLKTSKNRLSKYYKKINFKNNISFCHSNCYISKFENKYTIQYENFPICNPDFIYIDGPDIFNVKGVEDGFSYGHKDIMPISSDVLKIEYFLIPGTIILFDGRAANAQFLKDHFKRDWLYYADKKNDQHIFYLNAPSLGKLNDRLKKFYENN